MCDKAVDKCHFVFDSLPDQHKTKEMWHKLVSEDYFKFQYCHDSYKTQEICNKAFGDSLQALKIVLVSVFQQYND